MKNYKSEYIKLPKVAGVMSDERSRQAELGKCLSDGSFLILNKTDLYNAIDFIQKNNIYNYAKKHVIRRARAIGLLNEIPPAWLQNKI